MKPKDVDKMTREECFLALSRLSTNDLHDLIKAVLTENYRLISI